MTQPDGHSGSRSALDHQPLDNVVAALNAADLRAIAAELAALLKADLRRERERLGTAGAQRR